MTSELKTLIKGDQISLSVPLTAINIRIFGHTLEGSFDFPEPMISDNKWFDYLGKNLTNNFWVYSFKINAFPK